VHATIREEEVLESVLRIVVRELEMAGAAFPGAGFAEGGPQADDMTALALCRGSASPEMPA
jgi:hypothetical protein